MSWELIVSIVLLIGIFYIIFGFGGGETDCGCGCGGSKKRIYNATGGIMGTCPSATTTPVATTAATASSFAGKSKATLFPNLAVDTKSNPIAPYLNMQIPSNFSGKLPGQEFRGPGAIAAYFTGSEDPIPNPGIDMQGTDIRRDMSNPDIKPINRYYLSY